MFTCAASVHLGSSLWGVQMKGDIHEEQSVEFGLLSQLLFIFCALKSLEIQVSVQIPECSNISNEGRLRAGNSPHHISGSNKGKSKDYTLVLF